jgi:hypothetical protein
VPHLDNTTERTSNVTFIFVFENVKELVALKNVKLSVCLTKHYAMKAYRGVEV